MLPVPAVDKVEVPLTPPAVLTTDPEVGAAWPVALATSLEDTDVSLGIILILSLILVLESDVPGAGS